MDLIWSQLNEDDDLLKSNWISSGEPIEHLASTKNYLIELTLKAMRDFHRGRSPQREVEDLITDTHFLLSKGLRSEAKTTLIKAKGKAVKHELHSSAIQIDSIIRGVTTMLNSKNPETIIASLNRSTAEYIELIHRVTTLHCLYYETFLWRRNRAAFRENESQNLAKIEIHPLLDPSRDFPDFLSQFHRYRILDNILALKGLNHEAWHMQNNLLKLWKQYPHMILSNSAQYLNCLVNYLAASHATGNYKSIPPTISLLRETIPSSESEKFEIEHNCLFHQLLYDMNTCKWQEAGETGDLLQTFMERHMSRLPHSRILAIHYNLAICFFFLQRPKPALQPLNAILNDQKSQHREDIQQAARLMQAVVHYELGNTDLLEHLLRNAQHYMKKKGTLYAFEATLIRHLRQLITHPDNESDILQDLQNELSALKNDPANANAPGLEEIQYWIKSKLLGVPLHTLVGTPDKPNP